MLTLSTNRRRKRSKTFLYFVIIVSISILVILFLSKATSDDKIIVDENVQDISTEKNIKQSSENIESEEVIIEPVKDVEEETIVKDESPAESEPAKVFEGTDVQAANFQIKIPKQFFYSFSNEGGGQLLNIGTKNFGPDKPYDFSMTNDASGYISSIEQIPTESIGGLVESSEVQTNAGIKMQKKVYQTNIEGSGAVMQILYTFELNSKKYGAILWTAANNESFSTLFSDTIKTIKP